MEITCRASFCFLILTTTSFYQLLALSLDLSLPLIFIRKACISLIVSSIVERLIKHSCWTLDAKRSSNRSARSSKTSCHSRKNLPQGTFKVQAVTALFASSKFTPFRPNPPGLRIFWILYFEKRVSDQRPNQISPISWQWGP